jgi:hypothetical protein
MSVSLCAVNENETSSFDPKYPKVVHLPDEDPRNVNWNNGNATAMFKLLGLEWDGDFGKCSIPEARRAVMRARATFASRAQQCVCDDKIIYGKPRSQPGGVVTLRPVLGYEMGLDTDGLAKRLFAFSQFVEAVAELGATHITWA